MTEIYDNRRKLTVGRHLTDRELIELSMGEATEALRIRADEHLSHCQRCNTSLLFFEALEAPGRPATVSAADQRMIRNVLRSNQRTMERIPSELNLSEALGSIRRIFAPDRAGRMVLPEGCFANDEGNAAGEFFDTEAEEPAQTAESPAEQFETWMALAADQDDPARLQQFFLDLTSTDSVWVQVCQAVARGLAQRVPEDHDVRALFEQHVASLPTDNASWKPDTMQRALTMLDCARTLANEDLQTGTIEELEKRVLEVEPEATGWRKWLIAEMLCLLSGNNGAGVETLLSARRAGNVQLSVVMVRRDGNGNSQGLSAKLQLDLMNDGSGAVYPGAENCLVPVEESFAKSLEDALDFLRQSGFWDGQYDLRWTIRGSQPLKLMHRRSLGGAFALGAGELVGNQLPKESRPPLADRILRVTMRRWLCVAGAISGPDGKMGGIVRKGVKEKVDAALADPNIAFLVLPAAAREAVASFFKDDESVQRPGIFSLRAERSTERLTVICVSTLSHALDLIPQEWHMPEEFDWRKKLSSGSFVPRPWLKDRVDTFVRDSKSGGLFVLIGEGGSGKSAFISHCLGNLLDEGEKPVAHFVTRDYIHWNEPAEIYGSLSAQLRRKYGRTLEIAPDEQEATGVQWDALTAAKQLAADFARLSEQKIKETIWIEGLDNAYGDNERFWSEWGALHELIAALEGGRLPDGIKLIVTSRPGTQFDHLRRLKDYCERADHPEYCVNLNDPAWEKEVRTDLCRYFEHEVPQMDPGVREKVVGVVQRDRPFIHAVLWAPFLQYPANSKEEPTFNELLDKDLERVASYWKLLQPNLSEKEASMEVVDVLGLLACAREPLSPAIVNALFGEARAKQIAEIAKHASDRALLAGRTAEDGEERIFRFFHGCIAEFIVRDLPEKDDLYFLDRTKRKLAAKRKKPDIAKDPDMVMVWHRELAERCQGWKELDPSNPARSYALRFLLSHLRLAEMWEELEKTVTDVEFVQAKLGEDPGGIF